MNGSTSSDYPSPGGELDICSASVESRSTLKTSLDWGGGPNQADAAYSQEVSVMTEVTPLPVTGDPAAMMKQLVLEIVCALVDQPENVSVEMIQDRDATVIRLRVAHLDIGKVIGKQGRTARSLRTILGAASMKLHHRFSLDILEEGEQPRTV